jgi:hypothetical protein
MMQLINRQSSTSIQLIAWDGCGWMLDAVNFPFRDWHRRIKILNCERSNVGIRMICMFMCRAIMSDFGRLMLQDNDRHS